MARILTGIQSSGVPHLGNLLGAIIPAINMSKKDDNESLFFIADLHSLTTIKNAEAIKYNTYATAAAWLAFGFDTKKNIFYRQSDISEVTELMWILNCFTPYPMLANAHSFKDKANNLSDVNSGLFSYPVLMASDILLYDADIVPVGKDQLQHLEMTRDIAGSFNHLMGETFVIPESKTEDTVMIIPGTDGQKMSKSYGNTIPIFADENELKKSVMSIVTDSAGINEPKDKDTPLYKIYSLFLNHKDKELLSDRYDTPGLRYGDVKKELLDKIYEHINPYRKKRKYYIDNIDDVIQILIKGKEKAAIVANEYIKKIRKVMGIAY